MEDFAPFKHYDNNSFQYYFSKVDDPRRQDRGNLQHSFIDMIFLVVAAVVSGANTWKSIELFGHSQLDWLRKYAPFENGVPSQDTLGRVFAAMDFNQLCDCFIEWVKSINKLSEGEVVAIDGKRLRGSYDKSAKKNAIHMVTAFACGNGISLGQVATDEKSNEIIAIPKLLEMLVIKGCIVTIDAMGCQKKIAEKIIEKEADYILAIKENQRELLEQTKKLFSIEPTESYHEDLDSGHGRVETRKCTVIKSLDFLDVKEEWPALKCVIKIESDRYIKQTSKREQETRYYISSCNADAEKLNKSIRSHWHIENKLHWVLDMNFNEDHERKRKGDSAANFNLLTKIAMTFLSKEKTDRKTSMKCNRFKAALSSEYREKILNL